jgi:hypothetical protein
LGGDTFKHGREFDQPGFGFFLDLSWGLPERVLVELNGQVPSGFDFPASISIIHPAQMQFLAENILQQTHSSTDGVAAQDGANSKASSGGSIFMSRGGPTDG